MAEGGFESRDVTIENTAYDPRGYNTNAVSSNLTNNPSFGLGRPPSPGLENYRLPI